jgi:hypothetical protein
VLHVEFLSPRFHPNFPAMMLQQSLQQASQFHSMTIADEDISADDDILLMLFASAYCCVVSSPLFLESEDDWRSTPIRRRRKTIEGLLLEYGERNFERAYRMSFASFSHLHTLLHTSIARRDTAWHRRGGGLPRICTKVRLAAAIRYFGGGSVWDIMISHGMSRTETYESVWSIVDAVNTLLPVLQYPSCKEEQSKIARGFVRRSECSFDNCAGCIDGMLLWIDQPTQDSCRDAGVGPKKFFCGRKHKFQDYLVGNDNQPDGVTYVSCRCRPFLLNHCASLILRILLYHYRSMLFYFYWSLVFC